MPFNKEKSTQKMSSRVISDTRVTGSPALIQVILIPPTTRKAVPLPDTRLNPVTSALQGIVRVP